MTREEAIKIINCYDIGFYDLSGEKIPADKLAEAFDMAIEALSADAEPKMTEEVREALMRLTMCAREECKICKYKDKCNFDFQYEESTKNMNTILDSLMRSKCEVDAKWIPCSERLPDNKTYVLTTIHVSGRQPHARSGFYHDGFFHNDNGETWRATDRPLKAWMPLPEPYREDGEA